MNLYKILEIDKTATPDEIRKAYKRMASKHHPDKENGDEERFKEVQSAYDVLSDPVKKGRYDEDGTVIEDDFKGAAIDEVIKLVSSEIDASDDFDMRNIFRVVEDNLHKKTLNHEHSLEGAKIHLKKLKRLADKVIRKSGGENMFSTIIENKISMTEKDIKFIGFSLTVFAEAANILSEYDYKQIAGLTFKDYQYEEA